MGRADKDKEAKNRTITNLNLAAEAPTAHAQLVITLEHMKVRYSVNAGRGRRRLITSIILTAAALIAGVASGLATNFASSTTSLSFAVAGAVAAIGLGVSSGFILSLRSNRQERERLEDLEVALRQQAREPGTGERRRERASGSEDSLNVGDQEQGSGS